MKIIEEKLMINKEADKWLTTEKLCFQNRTGPGGRTVKTGNWDENWFFKPKESDFLLIP